MRMEIDGAGPFGSYSVVVVPLALDWTHPLRMSGSGAGLSGFEEGGHVEGDLGADGLGERD